jgi:hypothetical protein
LTSILFAIRERYKTLKFCCLWAFFVNYLQKDFWSYLESIKKRKSSIKSSHKASTRIASAYTFAEEESWCMRRSFRRANNQSNQSNQNHLMQNKDSREQKILVEYQLSLSKYLMMHLKTRKSFITFETWISWSTDWRKMKTLWSKREWIFEMRAFSSWTSTIRKSWSLKNLSLNTIIVLTNWTTQNSWFVSWRSNYEKRIWKIQMFSYLSLKTK